MKNHSDAVRVRQARSDLGVLVAVARGMLDGRLPQGPATFEALDSLLGMASLRLDALRLVEQVLVDPGMVERREQAIAGEPSAYARGAGATMDRSETPL